MPRASAALRLDRFNFLRAKALSVGLDLRIVPEPDAMAGFNEVFDPATGESLTAGVGVDFWLDGYTEARERTLSGLTL